MYDLLSINSKNLGNISLVSLLYVVSAFNIVIAGDAYPNKDEAVQTIPRSTHDVELDKNGSISGDEINDSFKRHDKNGDSMLSIQEYSAAVNFVALRARDNSPIGKPSGPDFKVK